jgi:CRP-like cAMP-binding protein
LVRGAGLSGRANRAKLAVVTDKGVRLDKPVQDTQTVILATLAQTRLFADWPVEVRQAIAASSLLQSVADGDYVLRRGVPSDHMVVVASGVLASQRTVKSGKVVVADFLLPGQSTSHLAVLDGFPPSFDVVARAPSRVVLIPRDAFLEAIRSSPERLYDVILFLCRRTRFDYEGSHLKAGNSLRCQIAKMLIYWARGTGIHSEGSFRVPVLLTQDDLAAILGAARQTINREIAALAKQGIVAKRYKQIEVLDAAALTAIIDAEDPTPLDMQAALFARPKNLMNASD